MRVGFADKEQSYKRTIESHGEPVMLMYITMDITSSYVCTCVSLGWTCPLIL